MPVKVSAYSDDDITCPNCGRHYYGDNKCPGHVITRPPATPKRFSKAELEEMSRKINLKLATIKSRERRTPEEIEDAKESERQMRYEQGMAKLGPVQKTELTCPYGNTSQPHTHRMTEYGLVMCHYE